MGKRGWLGAVCALVMACGGDGTDGDDELEPLEDAGDVPGDAAVDAGGDAAKPDAAAHGDAGVRVERVQAAGTCTAGQAVGTLLVSRCLGSAELATMGCVVGGQTAGGASTVVASREQMSRARFSIVYTAAQGTSVYLCTGAAPTTDFVCGTPLLGSCSSVVDQATCGTSYLLSPVPIQNVTCTR